MQRIAKLAIVFFLMNLVLSSANAQTSLTTKLSQYKITVDDSITNKTAAQSIRPTNVGNRYKDLADIVKSVVDTVRSGGASIDSNKYIKKADTGVLVMGIKQSKDSIAAVRSYVNGMGIDTVLSKGNQTAKTLTFKSGSAYNQQSYSNTIISNGTQIGSFNGYGIDWTPNGGSPTNVLQWRIPTVTGGAKVVNFQNDSGAVALLSDTVGGSGVVNRLVTQAGLNTSNTSLVKYSDTNTVIRTIAAANTTNATMVKYADTSTFIRTVASANTANALNIKYADTNSFVVSLVKARTLYHLKGGDTYAMTDTFGSKDAYNCVYMANGLAGLIMSGTDQSSQFLSTIEGGLTIKTSTQVGAVTIGVGRGTGIGANQPFISFNTSGTVALSTDPYYYGTGYTNNTLNPVFAWSGNSNTPVCFSGPGLQSSGSCFRYTLPRGSSGVSQYSPTSGFTANLTVCVTGASSRGAFAPTSGTASMVAIVDSAIINQTGGANGITGFISDDGVSLTSAADWRSIRLTKNSGRAISQEGTAINTLAGNTIIGATSDNGDKLQVTGNVNLTTAGNKIKVATGSNASVGTATLVGGTVTVSTTAVATGSKIFVSRNTVGGTTGDLSVPDASIVNGTSFVINSTSGSETSTINWWIIN